MKIIFSALVILLTVIAGHGQTLRTATATAVISGGFVVGITVTDGGSGYTNVPPVHINPTVTDGGGTNATATASVSGGVVTAITINNPGSGYGAVPAVNIAPPVVPIPQLTVAPAANLFFTDLQTNYGYHSWAGVYYLMKNISGIWSNQEPPNVYFASTGTLQGTNAVYNYSTTVNGTATMGTYALGLFPLPVQASATAKVVNGFVTEIDVTSTGMGYNQVPTVEIVGGGGSGAQATANNKPTYSGQAPSLITLITVTSPGSGYTSVPSVVISAPDAPLQLTAPTSISPMVALNIDNLVTNLTYQLQSSSDLSVWTNVGTPFVPGATTDSIYLAATNAQGFFQLQYLP